MEYEINESYEFEYVDDDGNEFTWVAEGDQLEDACDKLNIPRQDWEDYVNDLWAYFEKEALEYKADLDFMADHYDISCIPRDEEIYKQIEEYERKEKHDKR